VTGQPLDRQSLARIFVRALASFRGASGEMMAHKTNGVSGLKMTLECHAKRRLLD
jgi:hypothetical protein